MKMDTMTVRLVGDHLHCGSQILRHCLRYQSHLVLLLLASVPTEFRSPGALVKTSTSHGEIVMPTHGHVSAQFSLEGVDQALW